MMNYLAALLGIALMGAITTAAVYRGDAANWHDKYTTLQSSYAQAALKTSQDAIAQEAKDTADNKRRADNAIAEAESQTQRAQQELKDYQIRLKKASGEKDLGHACSAVPIPADLIP